MYTTTLTSSSFNKLKKYNPGSNIPNTECELYLKGTKDKSKILIKKYYITEGEYFGKKLKNLNTLIYYKRYLETINELVLPSTLVIVQGEIIGYSMPFINNSTNLLTYLNHYNNTLENKIEYLKSIGKILEKIRNIKDFPYTFCLGDLHEANFIIDKDNNLKVVDLDSAYISNNEPFPSKYLTLNPLIKNLPYKYKVNSNNNYIPSINTDLYSYIIIFLNTISSTPMYKLSLNDFYRYINYLEDIGINKNLLLCIEKIYQNTDNTNLLYYLDNIDIKKLYMANHNVYRKRTNYTL